MTIVNRICELIGQAQAVFKEFKVLSFQQIATKVAGSTMTRDEDNGFSEWVIYGSLKNYCAATKIALTGRLL